MKHCLWKMFTNIKNGQISKRAFIYQKRTQMCDSLLKILWDEGYIIGYQIDTKDISRVKIFLKYRNNIPVIHSIKFLSKPGRRMYYSKKQIWKIDSSKSFILLSTNKGLKSILDCKRLCIGGEPLIAIG